MFAKKTDQPILGQDRYNALQLTYLQIQSGVWARPNLSYRGYWGVMATTATK